MRLHDVSVKPFEQVVDEHGPAVLRACRAILSPADADDAWSETFLAALRAYPQLRPGSNVRAWLVTIAHRKAIDVTRGAARRALPVGDVGNGAIHLGSDDRDLDLTRSLAALPDKQRYAVVYHYLIGLPYRDVAAVIGGTADAARRAAADGIAKLRRTHPSHTARKGHIE